MTENCEAGAVPVRDAFNYKLEPGDEVVFVTRVGNTRAPSFGQGVVEKFLIGHLVKVFQTARRVGDQIQKEERYVEVPANKISKIRIGDERPKESGQ